MDLTGKAAIVTGAGSGIGYAIAERLGAAGAAAVGEPREVAEVALFLASTPPPTSPARPTTSTGEWSATRPRSRLLCS